MADQNNVSNDTKMEEFQKACEPLFEYLKKHHHPHVSVIVTSSSAELVEGIRTVRIK